VIRVGSPWDSVCEAHYYPHTLWILDFGPFYFWGIFPRERSERVSSGGKGREPRRPCRELGAAGRRRRGGCKGARPP